MIDIFPYSALVWLHSWTRWLAVVALLALCLRSAYAYVAASHYTAADARLLSSAVGLSHLQVMLGLLMYVHSPLVAFMFSNPQEAMSHPEVLFFSTVHPLVMLLMVGVLTAGAGVVKRKLSPKEKFGVQNRTIIVCMAGVALVMPLPWVPWAVRPWLRPLSELF